MDLQVTNYMLVSSNFLYLKKNIVYVARSKCRPDRGQTRAQPSKIFSSWHLDVPTIATQQNS